MSKKPSIRALRIEAQRAAQEYRDAEEALQRAWERKRAAENALALAERAECMHFATLCPICDRR